MGQTIPGVAARVVDPATGEPLAHGKRAAVGLRSQSHAGLFELLVETAAVLRDGWYVTGDIAAMDADGFIRIALNEESHAALHYQSLPAD